MTTLAYVKVPTDIVMTHADPGEWAELQCYGALQPERGYFANRKVMDNVLGKARARRCVDRGDIELQADGRWYIADWDFQEGDRTVAERMKRWRTKRRERSASSKLFHLDADVPRGTKRRDRNAVDGADRNARDGRVVPL